MNKTYFIKIYSYFFLAIGMSLLITKVIIAQDSTSSIDTRGGVEAAGEFSPSGPPQKKPKRIEAGKSFIVDLIESYSISGTLLDKMEFN